MTHSKTVRRDNPYERRVHCTEQKNKQTVKTLVLVTTWDAKKHEIIRSNHLQLSRYRLMLLSVAR